MNLIVGILLLPIGLFIIKSGLKYFKSEQGSPTNSIDLVVLGIATVILGIGLIYGYFR